jgi:hypothetical protein
MRLARRCSSGQHLVCTIRFAMTKFIYIKTTRQGINEFRVVIRLVEEQNEK